jgi:ABC-2 type transport system permease protein
MIGVDKENRHDSREYADDFHEGITLAAFGGGAPYPARIRITGPADYRYNSVGTLVEDRIEGDRRVTTWQSDHPVNFFNVVAGRWAERRGPGTVIYYHEKHSYNIDEMIEALSASRRYYSEWFKPFPWAELKLSEFPGLAGYAQGFPTNITFSENIGFLTRSDPKANVAFMVTAHEAAHQWWGNMLVPGRGPGGDILSEGMSHFSTILLFDQVKGPRDRIAFCKLIESRYGDRRQVDSERPLVKIDGSRDGDETVTYDKGGWVFWMLMNEMGRERALGGIQAFIQKYSGGPDYPVLHDFVATMRPFAADSAAYENFVQQWFHSVTVPEYRLDNARVVAPADTAATDARWTVDVVVKNAGTGLMPVEVAATRGERFRGDDKEPDYEESRVLVTLGPDESQTVSIQCPFEPKQILVDPDARVLQINRKLAVVHL